MTGMGRNKFYAAMMMMMVVPACKCKTLVLPEILLLDEPTTSLDDKATDVIENLFINLKKSVLL